MPLYSNYHIMEYDGLRTNIKDIDYFNKLISLSNNGKWDADNVSFLQHTIQVNFSNKPKLFIELLGNKSSVEISSFWNFFFAGPAASGKKEFFNKTVSIVEKHDKNMVTVVREQFADILENWKFN